MRPLFLNLLTASATIALLVVLALPARAVLDNGRSTGAPVAVRDAPWPRPAGHPRRVFGAYVDPWHVDDWARSVGAAPQLVAKFQAFSRRQPLAPQLAKLHSIGIRRLLISWEPWKPVPAKWGADSQALPQPGYRNIDIAHGVQDRYIERFARTLAAFPGTVYLRYAHEMNGYWYPWTHGTRAYVWAWQRVVRIFDAVGAHNVRFVWSVNPNLYERAATWKRGVAPYWPGSRYVDTVGSTMINFGGTKSYPVDRFAPRLRWLHSRYRKPVVLTETNTAYDGRVTWLRDLRRLLAAAPWIPVVAWSQLPSHAHANQQGIGDLEWDVQSDPAAAAQLRGIVGDGLR